MLAPVTMPTAKRDSDTPSSSVVQPISMKRDFFEKASKAARMDGLTFAAYTRQLIHKDLLTKGIITLD